MSNELDYLGSGDASQPEHIIPDTTSQQPMQFSGHTDLHDETGGEKSDPQGRLFGTHIREAVGIVKDWVSGKDHSE